MLFLRALLRMLGYVPVTELTTVVAQKDQVENELRNKNRSLECQLLLRDRLQSEVDFLREVEVMHARKESGVQRACEKLDIVTATLQEMMESVWPEACLRSEPASSTRLGDTQEVVAVR